MARAASSPPPSPIADEREMRSRRRSTNNEHGPLACRGSRRRGMSEANRGGDGLCAGGEGGKGERSLLRICAISLLLCWSGFSLSQDFPTLKGDNARTGHNN